MRPTRYQLRYHHLDLGAAVVAAAAKATTCALPIMLSVAANRLGVLPGVAGVAASHCEGCCQPSGGLLPDVVGLLSIAVKVGDSGCKICRPSLRASLPVVATAAATRFEGHC